MSFARMSILLIAVVVAAGCNTPTAPRSTTPRPKASAASTGSPSPGVASPGTTLPGLSSPGPGLTSPAPELSPGPLAVVSLSGRLKAPASLIGNNGASLISDKGLGLIGNNGAGIIGNNSGGYRVAQAPMAPEQFYIPNAKVELVDATGKPLLGADGAPLVTTTGTDGAYSFKAVLPKRHFVVRATLADRPGALRRLIAPGVSSAEVDLGTSLVASYVLDRYVGTQADPQATLDRLPADQEARAAAMADAAALTAPLPESLEPAKLVAALTDLRRADAALDRQMEVVKRLLIPAGAANLGVGLPANQLFFRRIDRMEAAADGTVFAFTQTERVLWRFAPDGTVAIAAGNTSIPSATEPVSRDGLRADAIALDQITRIWPDGAGGVVVKETQHGIWRLDAGGVCRQWFTQAEIGTASGLEGAHMRPDGTMVYLKNGALYAWTPNGQPRQLAVAPGAPGAHVVELVADQRWLVVGLKGATTYEVGQTPVVNWAGSDIPERVGGVVDPLDLRQPSIDARGHVFYEGATDRLLHRRGPDGVDVVVQEAKNLALGMAQGLTLSNGQIYLLDCHSNNNASPALIRRLAAPGATLVTVAGLDGVARGITPSGVIPLLYPTGLDVAPDGTIYVADAGSIVAVPPGNAAPRIVLAKGTSLPAAGEPLQFTGVKLTAAGKLVVRAFGAERELILRETSTGTYDAPVIITEDFANKQNVVIHAWDVAPDGTIVYSDNNLGGASGFDRIGRVMRVKPSAAAPEEVVPFSAGLGWIARLAFGPDGVLRLAEEDGAFKPQRKVVGPTGVLTPLTTGLFLPEVADPEGRAYGGDAVTLQSINLGDGRIRRQALSGEVSMLAGQGTPLLNGASLADSIAWAEDLCFDAQGNLYFRDAKRRLVRRIPHFLL